MERLTQTTEERVLLGIEYPTYLSPEMCKAYDERLKAYEDTGLTPEDIKELCTDDVAELARMLHKMIETGQADRFAELAKADDEGRLVVLPCKVGDTVYRLWKTRGREPVITAHYMTDYGMVVRWMHYFGKTVFLTREEAEAALKGEGNG